MKKTLCILFSTPVLAAYENRYGMNYFRKQGWEVCIWDLSPILNPLAHLNIVTDLIDYSAVKVFGTKDEYKIYFRGVPEGAFFILTMDFYYDNYFVYRCFKKKQHYGYMNRMDTNVEVILPSTEKKKKLFSYFILRRIRNSIFIRIPRWMLLTRAADFLILGGKAQAKEYIALCVTGKGTCIKSIHSLDYEKFLKVRGGEIRIVKERYCLFLDQYLPYHPDNLECKNLIDANLYYEELSEYFRYLENQLHIQVVIAAHPRSNYGLHKDIFYEFIVKKNLSCELVKDAEFVIAHFSTSLSYAALFYKPVIILDMDGFNKIKLFKLTLEKYAGLLGADIVNISDKKYLVEKMEVLPIVNVEKYNDFITDYIKADYEDENKNDESFYAQVEKLLVKLL